MSSTHAYAHYTYYRLTCLMCLTYLMCLIQCPWIFKRILRYSYSEIIFLLNDFTTQIFLDMYLLLPAFFYFNQIDYIQRHQIGLSSESYWLVLNFLLLVTVKSTLRESGDLECRSQLSSRCKHRTSKWPHFLSQH